MGSLYERIRHTRLFQILYSVFYLIRRLIFAILLVTLIDYPGLCFLHIIVLDIIFVCYISQIKPADTTLTHRVELSNEMLL